MQSRPEQNIQRQVERPGPVGGTQYRRGGVEVPEPCLDRLGGIARDQIRLVRMHITFTYFDVVDS